MYTCMYMYMCNTCTVDVQCVYCFSIPLFVLSSFFHFFLCLSPSFPLSHSFLLFSLPPSLPPSLPLSSLQVQLGQEDLETAIRLGISMAESIVPLIKKKSEPKTLILKINYFFKLVEN